MARENQSFWTTLPGILTGCAAIITAIGALIGALVVAGIIETDSDSTTPSSSNNTSDVTFTFYPTSLRRGDEVQLFVNPPQQHVELYFNGMILPKKVLSGGSILVATIPSNGVSGYLELRWSDGKIVRASEILTVLN